MKICKLFNVYCRQMSVVFSAINGWNMKGGRKKEIEFKLVDVSFGVQYIINTFQYPKLSRRHGQRCMRALPGKPILFGPTHEIMALIALRKLNLQTRMRSNPLGLHIWYLVRPFVYFHTLCVWTAKALARSLAWGFAVRLCDKYHNLMSWPILTFETHRLNEIVANIVSMNVWQFGNRKWLFVYVYMIETI